MQISNRCSFGGSHTIFQPYNVMSVKRNRVLFCEVLINVLTNVTPRSRIYFLFGFLLGLWLMAYGQLCQYSSPPNAPQVNRVVRSLHVKKKKIAFLDFVVVVVVLFSQGKVLSSSLFVCLLSDSFPGLWTHGGSRGGSFPILDLLFLSRSRLIGSRPQSELGFAPSSAGKPRPLALDS